MEDYRTQAEPRAMVNGIPIFCAHDELVDIEKAVPNPRNPNQHPKEQIELLARIIRAQGWRQPITISRRSGLIVKGHGRLQAALLLGVDKVPVDYQNYATEAEEIADMTADNRLAELADMNNTMLAELLAEIDTGELPLELTGYTEEDIEGIIDALSSEEDAEPNNQDDAVEQLTTPMARSGDIWMLGEHRLICGDATKAEVLERLMQGEKAAMVHTDPPYGVSYNGGAGTIQSDGSRVSPWDGEADWDEQSDAEDLARKLLIPALNLCRKHTIPKAAFYIWHSTNNRRAFENALEAAGLMERQYLIWYKNKLVLGRGDYQLVYEPCFYAAKDGERPNWYGDRTQETVFTITVRRDGEMETVLGNGLVLTDGRGAKLYLTKKPPKGKKVRYVRLEDSKPVFLYDEDKTTSVWQIDRQTANKLHPTQKPVELAVRAIENSSQPQEIVLDVFAGSGSTLMAAEQTERRCFAVEINENYCDVIISRYILETGNLGVKCLRDGEEIAYIELVRAWAKENGKEEEVNSMKRPVVVTKRTAKVKGASDR